MTVDDWSRVEPVTIERDHVGCKSPSRGRCCGHVIPNVNDNRGALMPVTSGVPGSAKVVEPRGELELMGMELP